MTPEQEQKLFTTLGYIRKGLKNNTKAIEKQNGNVADLTKRVNKHDIFLGKVGLGVSFAAFFITIAVNGALAWFKLIK
ncbi:hypothetical protein LCGC14_0958310 [marine sediment metagenome]|uniref:Uncharacterized protein n=1 Tax=marine sediment metagenome TaxID=412755 RepID=A0A0F9NF62_9ZZZZ